MGCFFMQDICVDTYYPTIPYHSIKPFFIAHKCHLTLNQITNQNRNLRSNRGKFETFMYYDGNIIRKFYIPQLSSYKLFSITLLQSIIESALYKLRVININQINRFELNILLQATSYVDIILSSFYTRIKAICL